MAVHLTLVKRAMTLPAVLNQQEIRSQMELPDISTAVGKDITIAAAAFLIPEDVVTIGMFETTGTGFRYALGASDVTVPAAPNAHRWESVIGQLFVGVVPGTYFITAAA